MKPRQVRAAIYTRVSSDERLGQTFNSLDAQRDSCEHFIACRKHEGWICLPDRFDDGGISGGTLKRPELQRLLELVKARRVDAVVVYRMDRLTRSLRDFSELIDLFDSHNVSLVSTTESVDTTSAGGRLMLNLTLSFAQHEREIASERTIHKIAASRRRGLWTGGRPVLGYNAGGPLLAVNQAEAELVRRIFGEYLARKSIGLVVAELTNAGLRAKSWTSRAGEPVGGGQFSKSVVHAILTNPLYVGRVPYKGQSLPGQHAGIVDPGVFAKVQAMLTENGRSGASLVRNKYGGLLKGLLRCAACASVMTHTTTTSKSGVLHRYYSCNLANPKPRRCRLLPAGDIEQVVLEGVKEQVLERGLSGLVLELARERANERIRELEARVTLRRQDLGAAGTVSDDQPRAPGDRNAAADIRRLEADLEVARRAVPTLAEASHGLQLFEPMWAALSPTERAQLVGLIVETVRFDAALGEVEVVFREGSEVNK